MKLKISLLLVLIFFAHLLWAIEPNKDNVALVERNEYTTFRTLSDYKELLGSEFTSALHNLRAGQSWIDVGAGMAVASIEYLNLGGVGNVVAIVAEGSNLPYVLNVKEPYRNRFEYLSGKYLEEYENQELPRAELITDVYGALAYTGNFDVVLRKLLNFLAVGGKLISYAGYPYFTKDQVSYHISIYSKKDLKRSINRDWFSSIRGVRIEQFGSSNSITVFTKTSEDIFVPELDLYYYDKNGMPPERKFITRD